MPRRNGQQFTPIFAPFANMGQHTGQERGRLISHPAVSVVRARQFMSVSACRAAVASSSPRSPSGSPSFFASGHICSRRLPVSSGLRLSDVIEVLSSTGVKKRRSKVDDRRGGRAESGRPRPIRRSRPARRVSRPHTSLLKAQLAFAHESHAGDSSDKKVTGSDREQVHRQ